MCAKHFKSISTSRCELEPQSGNDFSSARGNTVRSRYRVLRAAMGRPIPRSVDRNCAGLNAKSKDSSVKGSSPDKHLISVVAEQVCSSEGSTRWPRATGTTGVQDLGMYRRLILELGRSLEGRSRSNRNERFWTRFSGQKLKLKSKIIPTREVRWARSSWEVR